MYRVKQFFKGLYNYMPPGKIGIIDKYLSYDEREIFMQLPNHERNHAVDTAFTVLSLGPPYRTETIVKAALLHDIGKIEGKPGIIKKSILVLMDKIFPSLSYKLSRRLKMFYIYYNHPEIGAKLLENINTDKHAVELVRYHHSDGHNDIAGMEVLKKADSLN
jgi:putative nucleotidyltransferase with HDIG domain